MKNLKIRRMIIVLLVAVAMVTISTDVLATDLVNPINILTNAEQVPEVNTEVPAPTTNVETPATNAEENQNTLPQTGDASDYAIFLLIGACVVVSIYAYKKVRDYNRI